ncbi:RNA-directed DNA polymerase from mobile element jockey [Trichonephila clavipes]|nr:RNA-directed DNA polymerase from mobile element jockey [Trichonephila clavipes]
MANDRSQPHTHASGGTAILVKSSLKHHLIPTPQLGVVEATSVVLTPPNDDPLLLASIYIPPTTNPATAISDLEVIFSLGHSSILCGDYNAHHTDWGCISNNQRGLLLRNFTDDTDTDILAPPTPTRFGYNSASTIDFALTRHFHWRTSINSISELSSDHNPIILNFKTSIKFDFPTRTVTTDWNLFRHTLKTNTSFQPITAHSREEIEKLTANITSNILHAYDLSSKPIQNKNKTYIDSDLKSLFKQRNRARKTWQFTRDPNDKTILNRLQNKIHRKVNALTQKQWEDKLTSLDPEDGSLWNMAKGFRKKRSPISALTGPTGIAYTDTQKAETLANALEDQFQLNNIQNPDTDNQHMRLVDRFFINDNNFDDIPISTKPSELLQYIKKLKIKKAPGRDKITNKMVLNFPTSVIFQLTNLINKILHSGHFPQAWKTATVIPILKPGKDPTLATSHRPISLLPVLSKLAERIILNRLNDHLQQNDILIPQQHGFRANLSTSHQLLRMVEYVKTGFAENKSTGAVFLDIQKAFDRNKLLDYLPLRGRHSNSGAKRKPTNTSTSTTQTLGETGTLALHLENRTECRKNGGSLLFSQH